MVRSGNESGPAEGILVGLSWFKTISVEFSIASTLLVPQFLAPSSRVEENHVSSWALKSPMIRMLPV